MEGQAQVIFERKVIEVYQETGWSLDRIGKMFRRTDRSIAWILRKHGVELPKRGRPKKREKPC